MNPQAFFFIETQFDNLGDALINRELVRQVVRHADVTLGLARVPESFLDMLGRSFLEGLRCDRVRGRSRFLLHVLFCQLKGARCFLFLSPGGWIGELDGRLNLRSWAHTALYYLLSFCGVRICQLGVSYEDIGPKLRLLLRGRSGAMYRHFVRDALSRKTMQEIGVRIDGICPDLAFNAFGNGGNNPEGVTFSFRVDQYVSQLDDIKVFIAFFLKCYGLEKAVYFVAQVKKDRDANKDLAAWVSKEFGLQATYEDGCEEIATAEKWYARSRVMVSNRLHSLLLAGSVGNAMVAAPIGEVNKKIRALFKDMGLEMNVFERAEDADRLGKAIQTMTEAAAQKKAIDDCFDALFQGRAGS